MRTILILAALAALAGGAGCGFDFQGSLSVQPHIQTCSPSVVEPPCQPAVIEVPPPCQPPPVVVFARPACQPPITVCRAPSISFRCPLPPAVRIYHRR